MCAHLGEIVGATGDIEGTGALIIRQPEEFLIFLFCKKNYFCICFFCIFYFWEIAGATGGDRGTYHPTSRRTSDSSREKIFYLTIWV